MPLVTAIETLPTLRRRSSSYRVLAPGMSKFGRVLLLAALIIACDRSPNPVSRGIEANRSTETRPDQLAGNQSGMKADSTQTSQPPIPPNSSRRLIGGFSDVFQFVGRIPLEESAEVLNVMPLIRLENDGGFLVADKREQQIRNYDSRGRLRWHFGALGEGPGEFTSPVVAIRLDSTLILALDGSAPRAVLWHQRRREPINTMLHQLQAVEDADLVDDSTVLYSARPSVAAEDGHASYALHLVDPRTGKIRRSFLRPTITEENRRANMIAGWSSSLVRGDTIFSVLSLSDTVYVLNTQGQQFAKIPFPTDQFVKLHQGTRAPNGRINLTTVSLSTAVHRMSNGVLVVQYQEIPNNVPRFHLVGFKMSGEKVFEVTESPRLWGIHSNDVFYFADPDTITPNVILTTRLRVGNGK